MCKTTPTIGLSQAPQRETCHECRDRRHHCRELPTMPCGLELLSGSVALLTCPRTRRLLSSAWITILRIVLSAVGSNVLTWSNDVRFVAIGGWIWSNNGISPAAADRSTLAPSDVIVQVRRLDLRVVHVLKLADRRSGVNGLFLDGDRF